jgi:hypothetical protein
MELIDSLDVIWYDVMAKNHAVPHALTINLTQHDSHEPDDGPQIIDYHHLGMSRDDGMAMSMELNGSMLLEFTTKPLSPT